MRRTSMVPDSEIENAEVEEAMKIIQGVGVTVEN
jgi:hypothetical protein